MPSYEDFKVGDVWVRRDGNVGIVELIDTVDKTILILFGDYTLWYHGGGRSLCKEDKYDLIHKKLDTSKPIRLISTGCVVKYVERTESGRYVVEFAGLQTPKEACELENVPVEKRKKTEEMFLIEHGGSLHIVNFCPADQILGRKTITIEEGEGL